MTRPVSTLKVGDDPNGDKRTIDDALSVLAKGNELKKSNHPWQAANSFLEGIHILRYLSSVQSRETEEDRQIAKLYEEKAQEYHEQSKNLVVDTMTFEVRSEKLKEDFYTTLSDEDAQLRNLVFTTLFSKDTEAFSEKRSEKDQKDIIDQQSSIEERLQALNATLPSGFKTEQERLDTINQGLNKLGLSLYPQRKPFESFQDTLPKSEEEQVQDIMAQAKDEIAFERQFGNDSAGTNSIAAVGKDRHLDEYDDSSEEEEEEDCSNLNDEQIAIKNICKRVYKAQRQLAEFIPLLEDASLAKSDEKLMDDSSQDSGENLVIGKKKLQSAQRQLEKAMSLLNLEI